MMLRIHMGCMVVGVLLCSLGIAQAGSFFKVGEPAPNFALTSLDGHKVSLEQYKGKVVVLGLFHICEPCLIQSTNLQKVTEAMKATNL